MEVWGLSRLPPSSASLASPARALPRRAVELTFSSPAQVIGFRRYGGYLASRRALPIWPSAGKGASAPGSRTEVLIPSLGHWIPLRGIVEVWGLSRLPASSANLAFGRKGASAPRSRTEVLIPSSGHFIPLRGIVEVWGLSRLRRALPIWPSAGKGASAPRSRTEVLIPSSGHFIPLRGIVEVWGFEPQKRN